MVTYGFYNSVDHDRTYDATQVSELFDGLINPGVYNSIGQRFKVEAVSNSFQVSVGTGRAWFNHTWTKNDAPLVLNLPAPPTMADRYRSDAIVIDINSDIKVRENKITYVCGEESANSNPPHPTLASGTHTQIPLAYIRRGAENAVETSIDPSQVNYVVGTDDGPPWVVGVLQTADISVYVQRWEDAWSTWFTGKQQSVTDDINAVHTARTNAETSINTDKAAFKAFVTEQVSEFTVWMSDKKDGFDTWFANLQYILDGDVAGHLQNEIEALQTRVTPINKGGTGNTHGHIQSGQKNITDYTKGEFSTSEGMNTAAPGKCAHAEGAGEYTYTHVNAHFGGDEGYYRNAVDVYPTYYTRSPCPSIGSEEVVNPLTQFKVVKYDAISGAGIDADTLIDEIGEEAYNAQQNIGDEREFYLGIALYDNTTGEVLKREIQHVNLINKPEVIFSVDYVEDPFYQNEQYLATAYWYMDGDTPENSNVLVKSTYWLHEINGGVYIDHLTCVPLKYEEYHQHDIMEVDYDLTEYQMIGRDRYPTITTKGGNDHTYSIQMYYAYTLTSEDIGVVHPIVWLPPGDVVTVSGRPTRAIGDYSHAEGYHTKAHGNYSHAEGYGYSDDAQDINAPGANGIAAHSEGYSTYAFGDYSHSEGYYTRADGSASHSSGMFTEAKGARSYAGGYQIKAYDDNQFVFGCNFLVPGSGYSNEIKLLNTSAFGLSLDPRAKVNGSDETSNITSLDKANEIANKNRNGFSAYIKCGTTKNTISYKTLMPNDVFATYLEFIELIDGDPDDNLIAHSCRLLKLYPLGTGGSNCGLIECTKLYETNNITNTVIIGTGSDITINGVVYKYPIIELKNSIDIAITSNNVNRYIRYTLTRLL